LWLHNNQSLHPLAVPLLLLSVVVAVYYPSLLSGTNSVDDPHIIAYFSSLPNLSEILLPGKHYYYRPVAEMTYYLDSLLWGMEPRLMHLENVLLHAVNAILVYQLARRIIGTQTGGLSNAPVYCALLFALHPLNVEAVSWIAGRTDPLATLFILSALLFLIRLLENGGWMNGLLAFLLSLLGMLAKEIAVVFVPLAILLAIWYPATFAGLSRRNRLGILLSCLAALLLMLPLIARLRQGGSGLDRFLLDGLNDLPHAIWSALAAFGFYLKKLVVPVPLNFAIVEISPLYPYLGIGGGALLVLAARRNRIVTLLFVMAAISALPALFVAVRQVAWTPYAERYMYLPSAFFTMGVVKMAVSLNRKLPNGSDALVLILICIVAAVSLQRTVLWQNNLALFSDTVAKSPGFGASRNELGVALMLGERFNDAEREFALADRLNKRDSIKMTIKSNIMRVMIAKGDSIGARRYFFELFPEKDKATADFLDLLHKADSARFNAQSQAERLVLADDLMETLDILYSKDRNPFWLYRSGQISILTGSGEEAARFFRRAYEAAPADAHYRTAAARYLQKLEGKQ
jgi:tetratricopeptide (TPR) repeat protein